MERGRYESLDGLRGVAALSVVVFHFFCAYIPDLVPGYGKHPWWICDTPLAVFYNGSFAVAVFFVLSGFVVSNSAAKRALPLAFNLVQRYARLAVPVLASTLLAWALLESFPDAPHRLKLALPHPWLEYVYDGNLPGFAYAVASGAVLAFLRYSYFNNPLWTMQIELIGSWLLYLIYALSEGRVRLWLLALFGLVPLAIAMPEYSAFAIGALMREAVAARRLPSRFAWPALGFAVLFGAMMYGYTDRLFGVHLPFLVAPGSPNKLWHVLAAAAILYAVLNLAPLQALLSTAPARFLGRVSFGLYLVHVPLLYTIFALLWLALPAHGAATMLPLLAAYLATVLLGGYLFTLAVDSPVLRAIHWAQHRVRTRVALRA